MQEPNGAAVRAADVGAGGGGGAAPAPARGAPVGEMTSAGTTSGSVGRPGYGIGALARRLGVAPATLRDWERRYGLGPGGRTAGGHRRYRPEDVARIEFMRGLVLDGVPPAEAARAALAAAAAERPGLVPAGGSMPGRAPGPAPGPDADPAGPGGAGGRSLPLARQLPQARGLARAVLALDAPAITGILDRSLSERGVVATWERLAVPVLTAVGERHAATGACVDAEHLLSAQLLAVLATRAGRLEEPRNSRSILLACADGELHSLPLSRSRRPWPSGG